MLCDAELIELKAWAKDIWSKLGDIGLNSEMEAENLQSMRSLLQTPYVKKLKKKMDDESCMSWTSPGTKIYDKDKISW